ncbi:hypothetical protein GCM10010402_34420 [Actinomadura luteofluorescens]|uniref:hypothetical protein n=1 Tax=Actinomadura luteofluorescens TaxID=46163 RepID=UPI0021647D64|nr:hypothetical protein [Actinomadura glauciflava]MCR3743112.1 hypothetical protein [Actinomadura glauciflava]
MPVTTDLSAPRLRPWRRSLGGVFVWLLVTLSIGAALSSPEPRTAFGLDPTDVWGSAAAAFATGTAAIVATSRWLQKHAAGRDS